jgi:hypothetical protein
LRLSLNCYRDILDACRKFVRNVKQTVLGVDADSSVQRVFLEGTIRSRHLDRMYSIIAGNCRQCELRHVRIPGKSGKNDYSW